MIQRQGLVEIVLLDKNKCRLLNLQSRSFNYAGLLMHQRMRLSLWKLEPSFAWKLNFLYKLSNPGHNLGFFNQPQILIGDLPS